MGHDRLPDTQAVQPSLHGTHVSCCQALAVRHLLQCQHSTCQHTRTALLLLLFSTRLWSYLNNNYCFLGCVAAASLRLQHQQQQGILFEEEVLAVVVCVLMCRTVDFCAEAVQTLNRRLALAPADNWFMSNI